MTWYSQAGQDRWVVEMMERYGTGGCFGHFVDLGAYDGVQTSNTYSLELLGWSGVCVEANPDYFAALTVNRPAAYNVHAAVVGHHRQLRWSGQEPTADLLSPTVPTVTLAELLDGQATVDYLSIDVEGMEYEVLEAFDFTTCRVNLMTVEHNLYCDGPANKDRLHALLSDRGFVRVVEDAPCLDPNPLYHMKPYEDWYAANALLLTE